MTSLSGVPSYLILKSLVAPKKMLPSAVSNEIPSLSNTVVAAPPLDPIAETVVLDPSVDRVGSTVRSELEAVCRTPIVAVPFVTWSLTN